MHVVYYLNHLCSPISPQGSPTWGRAVWSTAWRAWGPVMQESREGSPGEWSWTIHDSDGSPFYSQMVRNCMKHDEVEDLTKQWSLYSIQHWASYTSSGSCQLGQNSQTLGYVCFPEFAQCMTVIWSFPPNTPDVWPLQVLPRRPHI